MTTLETKMGIMRDPNVPSGLNASTTIKREYWVDYVKVIACFFVVVGHFFQSMVMAGFLPESRLYFWFEDTIYTFHVPLFFICSGYLYQRYTHIEGIKNWFHNIARKATSLGVPYIAFTCLTLAMKKLAGNAVNYAGGGVFETLLVTPTAPYWYLYTLFLLFVIIIPVQTMRRMMLLVIFALAAKNATLIPTLTFDALPFAIGSCCSEAVWFVGGMFLSESGLVELIADKRLLFGALFLPLSVVLFELGLLGGVGSLVTGILACGFVLCIAHRIDRSRPRRIWDFCARYTMPVFLMHTIFAAGFRVLLGKLGIMFLPLHLIGGLLISFVGPVFAMTLMERLRPLDCLVYPSRYIHVRGKHGHAQ